MNARKTLLALLLASAFGTVSAPTQADIIVHVAPPPDRYEYVPGPRHGYVWENGHYQWRNGRYVWIPGHWQRVRPGYVHVQPRWVERHGRWHYEARRWDRDRDGIPNNRDRDRDGDGVPNRYDRAPDNPRRS
jgi:hypothetical protein